MNLEEIKEIYPNATYDNFTYTIEILKNIFCFITSDFDICMWQESNYEDIICFDDILQDLPQMTNDNLLEVLEIIKKRILFDNTYAAGFDMNEDAEIQEFQPYDPTKDIFWNNVINKCNIDRNRKLHIYTYGDQYLTNSPKKSQQKFNASILRSEFKRNKTMIKELRKLRGTNPKLQQEIRQSKLFENFVFDIIKTIENNNLTCISIFCRAGHHRSVACAEMLKNLYNNATIEHLTIDL